MKKIFEIARWEYVEKIRTKSFIISLIITPFVIILFSIIPTMLSEDNPETTRIFGLLDETNISFTDLTQELSQYKLKNHQPVYLLINLNVNEKSFDENQNDADKKVIAGSIDGYILIYKMQNDSLGLEFRGRNFSSSQDITRFETALNNIALKQQLKANNINPQIINFNKNKISFNQIKITDSGGSNTDFLSVFYTSIIFIVLLTLMIIYSGQMLVRSLLEEKSNRLIEILISSCKSEELLTGKIIGLTALGLTQIIIWTFIAMVLTGINVISTNSLQNIPEILVYLILGYLFYTSLLVGIGSVVSTEQEAQQVTSYLSMILIIPIVIILPAMQNPQSDLIKILSFIPLTLPSVMILKLNITNITILEFAITVIIMIISIFLTITISAKIFKIGILYYDKMPTLKELKNWIFQK